MSWADVVIVVVVVLATYRGITVGALRQLGAVIGFVTGFVVGTMVAPALASHVHASTWRPLIAIAIVIVAAGTGGAIGGAIGAAANLSLRRLKLGSVDRVGGAALSAVGALVACWLVAGLLVNASFASFSTEIANSRILDVMDVVMPPVPSVEAKVQALFRTADFPSVFAEVVAPSVMPVTTPDGAATALAADGAPPSVLKVTSLNACGTDHEGTAFAVSGGRFVTAAHVIAGARRVLVNGVVARVLFFDKNNDVAVLQVHSRVSPISFVSSPPGVGTPAAVVGYPQNGGRRVTAAAVAGTLSALGRDIYDNELVTRSLVVISANVEPGNSGSPLLVKGRVAALVFSKSVVQDNVAYGVPAAVVESDLARATSSATASTGACVTN